MVGDPFQLKNSYTQGRYFTELSFGKSNFFSKIRNTEKVFFLCRTSSPTQLLHRLSPMFDLDPLFRRTFLFSIPVHNFDLVVSGGMFTTSEICWTLERVTKDCDVLLNEEVSQDANSDFE